MEETSNRRDLEELGREVGNLTGDMTVWARRLVIEHGAPARAVAGLLLVLADELRSRANEVWLAWSELAPEAREDDEKPKRGKSAPAGAADHRHVFGADGKCGKCGKAKGAGGRKARSAETERLSPEARTVPLPLGDAAADRFLGGAMGSSGVERR